jgi:hypothetical protein
MSYNYMKARLYCQSDECSGMVFCLWWCQLGTENRQLFALRNQKCFNLACRMPVARAGRSSASEEIESTCYFACPEIINAVEFSPYQNTSKLIAYGGESRICIGSCSFDDENLQEFQFEHQVDISHGARVDAIAWSPQSSLDQYPGLLR